MKNMFLRNSKGFTLFELIVVIAILGILALVLFPKLRNREDSAKIQAVEMDILKLYEAAQTWKANNGKNTFQGITDISVLKNAGVWDGHKSPFDTDYTISSNSTDNNQSVVISVQIGGTNASSICQSVANRITAKGYTANCNGSTVNAVIG